MIIYRIVAKHARPDADWETDAVMSAVRFTQGIHHGSSGESVQSDDEGDTVMVRGESSGMSNNHEKFATSESV
jgi:hypothetical protein